MGKLPGFAGKILRVNLSEHTLRVEDLNPVIARKFLGGVGYASHLLYTELEPGIDPMSADNKIVFAPGPLSDNRVPGGGSYFVCFKSPLTQIWGQSRSGGNMGPDIRRAGFDLIVVEGASMSPVYLEIAAGEAAICDASELVGKDVFEKMAWLDSRMPEKEGRASSLCIGPGGENLVKFAAIMHGERAAGRAGGGAVMGAKNLLGITVRAKTNVEVADSRGFAQATRETIATVRATDTCAGFHQYGTVGDLAANDEEGDWPTKNFRSNSWGEGAALLDHFQETNFIKPAGCYSGCPIACSRIVHVENGPYKTPVHEGAEYESISVFTAYSMNKDMDAAVHADYLCNKYGIDTISTGALIAFAMDCYEQGILTKNDVDGLALDWGNADTMIKLIPLIAQRQGLGDLLAEGVRAAAAKLGKGAEELAVHVKGLEGPAHDSRSGKCLGISYATGNRGMCHIQPVEAMAYDRGKVDWGLQKYGLRDPENVDRWDEKGKGKDVVLIQDGLTIPDIIGTCKFMCYAGVTTGHWARMLSCSTGWDIDGLELITIARRVNTLQRMFNVREGITRADDKLPKHANMVPEFGRYSDKPECTISDLGALLDEYYTQRGWDIATGIPTPATLRELGLEEYVEER